MAEDIGPNANPSEILVRKCHYAWNKFGKSFGLIGGQANKTKTNFRNIQMDAMRSYLMYVVIQMRKYLVQIADGCMSNKTEFNPENVFKFLIYQLMVV